MSQSTSRDIKHRMLDPTVNDINVFSQQMKAILSVITFSTHLLFKCDWLVDQTLLLEGFMVMKWPWHLLAQVKGLSCKRLRRTRTETLTGDLTRASPPGGRKMEEERWRKAGVRENSGLYSVSEGECRAEELRYKGTSVLWRSIKEEVFWCKTGGSISCTSIWLSSSTVNIDRNVSTCVVLVLCSPWIYCWTCSQSDPVAFHSVKRENKPKLQWVKTFRRRRELLEICTCVLHSESRHTPYNYHLHCILFVMIGPAQLLAAWHKHIIHIWPTGTEQTLVESV